MTVEKQVAIIFAAGKGLLDDIETNKVREFESAVLEHLENSHGDLLASINKSGEVSDDVAKKLEKGISDFKKGFKA
jgi:F-type H+-transporting ATPase subunit alpha